MTGKSLFEDINIKDLIIILTIFFTVGASYTDLKRDNKSIMENQVLINSHINDLSIMVTKYHDQFLEFGYNSDFYHTEVLGTKFQNGKPVDPSFPMRNVRKMVDTAVNGKTQKN